ncbi:MAG: dihydrofolate reductase family protein, partial [Pyrinomonadaceae bacterium]
MRKLFLHIGVSVDGYIENEKREFDWPVDDEWEEYINGVLRSIDGQIYGRVAHQSLAEYWPTAAEQPGASERLVETARMMNALPKYVLTRGPYETGWSNSHIIRGDVAGEIRKLKSQPGKDIALFAGASVAQSFMQMELLDEYRL